MYHLSCKEGTNTGLNTIRNGNDDAIDLAELSDALPRNTTSPNNSTPPSSFLALPAEIRIQIYEHTASYQIGNNRILAGHGRLPFRVSWTTSPQHLESRSEPVQQIEKLSALCRDIRHDVLPLFLRAYIVKFPAWNPDFKLQCLYRIDGVSEAFIRNVDFFWFEGVYWRFSICLGRRSVDEREDSEATKRDSCQYEESEKLVGDKMDFVLRVDFVRTMRSLAVGAARKAHGMLEEVLLERDEARLGRKELKRLLSEAALCAGEQLSSLDCENHGIRTVTSK